MNTRNPLEITKFSLFKSVSVFIQRRFLVDLETFPCVFRDVSLIIKRRFLVYLETFLSLFRDVLLYIVSAVCAPGVFAPLAYPVPPPTIIEDWIVL